MLLLKHKSIPHHKFLLVGISPIKRRNRTDMTLVVQPSVREVMMKVQSKVWYYLKNTALQPKIQLIIH